MQNTLILYPLCAMALLTVIVTTFMLRERLGRRGAAPPAQLYP